MEQGKLYVCATPIGNLEDVTLRLLRILAEADLIAAEDTRVTRKLLSKYEIKAHLLSYHEHNQAKREKELIGKIKQGLTVALVSDAGMPGLSDPGYKLIKACIELGIEIEVLPGPFAAVTALVASGLPINSFVFEGFLPRKRAQRKKMLKDLSREIRTLVLYESCHRIGKLLEDILEILGDRQIVLARELTKKYEEVIRGRVSQLLEVANERELKGEIVVVIAGATKHSNIPSKGAIQEKLIVLISKGTSKKDAVKKLAEEIDVPKRTIYEIAENLPVKKRGGN